MRVSLGNEKSFGKWAKAALFTKTFCICKWSGFFCQIFIQTLQKMK